MRDVFHNHDFFKNLPNDFIEELIQIAHLKSYKAGEYIFKEGGKAEHFFIILSGQINLELHAPSQKPIIVQSLKGEEILGWSWMYPPYEWTYDAHAVRDGQMFMIEGKALSELCEKNPECGYRLMHKFSEMMIQRLKSARIQLLDLFGDRKDD